MPEIITDTLHKIRAKLYSNYLTTIEGKYFARSSRVEAPLSVEQVCQSARNRGGYKGSPEDMAANVRLFHNESIYLIADGFAVQNEYYSIHPKISGVFERADEAPDGAKHRIELVHRERAALRRIFDKVEVHIDGIAEADAYIDEVVDVKTGVSDEVLSIGELFIAHGAKIKAGGDDPRVGVFFTDINGNDTQVPMDTIAENGSTKLIGKIPILAPGVWHLKIVTLQASGGTFLKEPRTILYPVDLTVQ
jgi:hypothetical protein